MHGNIIAKIVGNFLVKLIMELLYHSQETRLAKVSSRKLKCARIRMGASCRTDVRLLKGGSNTTTST